MIPLPRKHVEPLLQISEFYAPDQAAEIKHVVENRARCGRFRGGPGGCARIAVPRTDGEEGGEDGQDDDVTELLRPGGDGPAQPGHERHHTGVKNNVQLKKNRERFPATQTSPIRVLPPPYPPLP